MNIWESVTLLPTTNRHYPLAKGYMMTPGLAIALCRRWLDHLILHIQAMEAIEVGRPIVMGAAAAKFGLRPVHDVAEFRRSIGV